MDAGSLYSQMGQYKSVGDFSTWYTQQGGSADDAQQIWNAYQDAGPNNQNKFMYNLAGGGGSGIGDPTKSPLASRIGSINGGNPTASFQNQVMELFKQLTSPIAPNDPVWGPYLKSMVGTAASTAGGQAEQAGVQGGLAVQNTQDAAIGAANSTRLQALQGGLEAGGLGMQSYYNNLALQQGSQMNTMNMITGLLGVGLKGAGAAAGMAGGGGAGLGALAGILSQPSPGISNLAPPNYGGGGLGAAAPSTSPSYNPGV